jgi:hypothetical protein
MKDFSVIKNNILKYIDYKGISKYKFYQQTGITNGILSQKNGLSEENTLKVLSCFSDVNPEWLLTGKGEMLRGVEPVARQLETVKESAASPPVGGDVIAVYKELLREKDEKIAHQSEWIGELKAEKRYQMEENEELSEINSELERKNEELSIKSNCMEIKNETLKNLIEEMQEKLEFYELPKT